MLLFIFDTCIALGTIIFALGVRIIIQMHNCTKQGMNLVLQSPKIKLYLHCALVSKI